ncbi:hypothetical protein C1H46_007706 [Malus baccata]|uniref:Uncharacterized protein n=1 Tax=Malus baccata TaxID=106549 RepID=A0A540N813_MALBA|nr:hypothetical protein C1H46_007706 [Malus baccata]
MDKDIPLPPPPPPLPDEDSSWDYFDPMDESESFRFVGSSGVDVNFDDIKGWRQGRSEEASHSVEEMGRWAKVGLDGNVNSLNSGVDGSLQTCNGEGRQLVVGRNANGGATSLTGKVSVEQSGSKREKNVGEKDLCAKR